MFSLSLSIGESSLLQVSGRDGEAEKKPILM